MRKERKYRPLIVPKKEKKRKDEQVDDIFYYFYFIFPLGENKLGKTTIDRKRSIRFSFRFSNDLSARIEYYTNFTLAFKKNEIRTEKLNIEY